MTTKERAYLRGLASNLKDLVFVGKDGITENVVKQINDNLYAHELIKIKVQRNTNDELSNLSKIIMDKCNCEIISIIGNKILLYKVTDKPKFEHLL